MAATHVRQASRAGCFLNSDCQCQVMRTRCESLSVSAGSSMNYTLAQMSPESLGVVAGLSHHRIVLTHVPSSRWQVCSAARHSQLPKPRTSLLLLHIPGSTNTRTYVPPTLQAFPAPPHRRERVCLHLPPSHQPSHSSISSSAC